MPDNPTPEMLKKMRLEPPSGEESDDSPMVIDTPESSSAARRQSRRATVEDGDYEVDTSFAPGGDADYFAEEDGEGRFYGGGLTAEQKQILSIFESAEGEGTAEDVSANKGFAMCVLTWIEARGNINHKHKKNATKI
jgi:beta-catenin-like protein 1